MWKRTEIAKPNETITRIWLAAMRTAANARTTNNVRLPTTSS